MTRDELVKSINIKKSFLCVGLDSDIQKIPPYLHAFDDPVLEFNKIIIDNTASYTVAYKPNLAFYESLGIKGWESLQKTVEYIRTNYPGIFIIADAKRGDIGNTSKLYARAFFEVMNVDAVTVAPYMGEDSVKPFLEYDNKWVIILALTSNKGASDFQFMREKDEYLYEKVLKTTQDWGNCENIMYVVGATQAQMLKSIRKIIPNHFLLVPGVGAQGGSLTEVAEYGMNKTCGILVNSSRNIIFADSTENFGAVASQMAQELQSEMAALLSKKGGA
ncbi:MAG: orotidine-5'-phosphate decarboxylase [Bacteroidales bacterium]|nr:orotidine-5'-phosphate decarboxylase [Bacteroidales bacterium]